MATQVGLAAVERLRNLQSEFRKLENELNAMQTQYRNLSAVQGKLCSSALETSLSSLFKVIIYVNDNDTSLVEWHYRSDKLKTALRFVGVDRRTHKLVDKKTEKIKNKVSKVEAKFNDARVTVSNGLDSMQSLNKNMVRFAVSSVGEVSAQTVEAYDSCDRNRKSISTQITVQQTDHDDVQGKANEIVQSIRESKSAQTTAKENKEWHDGATRLGALATVGSVAGAFLFPPSLFATAPLILATAASAAKGSEYSNTLEQLQSQEEEFNQQMKDSQRKLDVLKAQLTSLGAQHDMLIRAKDEAESLQTKTCTVQAEAQAILEDLRSTRVSLNGISAKLRAISRELHECGYAQTRREIAIKLRGTLNLIEGVTSKRNIVLSVKQSQKAAKALLDMSERTPEVLKIMGI